MPEKPGYVIVAAETEGGADAGPPLATLLASASPDAGKAIFAKCGTCHTIDQGAANGIGPNLYGVIGEPIGKGKAGFAFSSALVGQGRQLDLRGPQCVADEPARLRTRHQDELCGLVQA